MMEYVCVFILPFSIILPVIAGSIAVKKSDATFYPIFIAVCLGLVAETASFFLIRAGKENLLVYDTYSFLEVIFLFWQFGKWRHEKIYYLLALLFGIAWLAIHFYPNKYTTDLNSYYNITYAFIVVVFSIQEINGIILSSRINILRNATGLFCIGLCLFFTYAILVECLWLYGLNMGGHFGAEVFRVMSFVNVISNIIFAFAFLCIPRKQTLLLQSL